MTITVLDRRGNAVQIEDVKVIEQFWAGLLCALKFNDGSQDVIATETILTVEV